GRHPSRTRHTLSPPLVADPPEACPAQLLVTLRHLDRRRQHRVRTRIGHLEQPVLRHAPERLQPFRPRSRGTGGDSATSSNLTDAAGFTGDPGSSTGAGIGDTSSTPAGGDSSGAFASSDSSSTSDNRAATAGEHIGQELGGVAAAPPVSAMSAASAGAGGTAGGSSSSSAAAKGPAPTGD